MPQKLTLASYLEGRGSVKALTRIEAEAFGIPYPLISGWPRTYGAMEITADMLADLEDRIGGARQSTASKALRGLRGIASESAGVAPPIARTKQAQARMPAAPARPAKATLFPGFVLRPARRYLSRRDVPWA